MKNVIFSILIMSTFFIYPNEWEIDTNNLLMSVISGYEINNNRKSDILKNEYYNIEGRVLLRISFSSDGEDYWRELFKYDVDGREIEKSIWSRVLNSEWQRTGYMKTEYFEEGDNYVVIESNEFYYRKIIEDPEDRIISIENTIYNKNGTEDYTYVEYKYEKTIDGFLRRNEYQNREIISKIDFLYNNENRLLERIIVMDDPELINTTENKYDEKGNIIETFFYQKYRLGIRIIFREGKQVQVELTEKEKNEIHILSRKIEYEYDGSGRLLSVKKNNESEKGNKYEENLFYSYYKQDSDGRYIQLITK